jgi:hypothetical protein
MQVKGQNYLFPVDAKIESEAQVAYKSINVNQILDEIDNGQGQANIVILDACRNNPLTGKFRSGATPGLAAPSSQPKSTVIVYATDPGNVSSDGEDRNGLFTAGLLTALKGSDLSLHGVLSLASAEVERGSIAAGNKQTPYVNGPMTLQDSFQFAPGSISKPPVRTEMVSPALDPAVIENNFWDSIKLSRDPADFEEYVKQYPAGLYAGLAHNKIRQLKAVAVKPEPTPTSVVEPPVAVRPEPTPAPVAEQSYKSSFRIGDTGPGGGIVFYVDSTSQHGLEAQAADYVKGSKIYFTWGDAKTVARSYGVGWHLPTKDELNQLYLQMAVVGGFFANGTEKGTYWSSTETEYANYAWFQTFGIGFQNGNAKSSGFRVRAVRAF